MKVSHLAQGDFERQPWKNGGGITTQLAVEGKAPEWLWRLSLAEVAQSGPFSDFSGYERTLVLVEGDGMELRVAGGTTVTLRKPFEPFAFDGGGKVDCTLLGGPVTDLNLMVARDRAKGSLEVVETARFGARILDARWVLAYAIRGRAIAIVGDVASRLQPGELVRIDEAGGEELELIAADPATQVALIRIDPK